MTQIGKVACTGVAETGMRRPIFLNSEMIVSRTLIDNQKSVRAMQPQVICHFFCRIWACQHSDLWGDNEA